MVVKRSHNSMVGTMVTLVIILVIVAGVIGYRWHLKAREKRKILNKWKMAYPQTTVVKLVQIESFLFPSWFQSFLFYL